MMSESLEGVSAMPDAPKPESAAARPTAIDQTRVNRVGPVITGSGGTGAAFLVQIYGPQLGKRYPLDRSPIIVGRDLASDVVVDLDNVSRRHCRLTAREGAIYLSDLNSTNGTLLNDRIVERECPLRSSDLIKVGGAIFKFLHGNDLEAQYHEEIYRLTIVDGLTQVHNKRYFLDFLEREMARCHRYSRALSLLLFDLDHFKKLNDEFGHLAGDFVLQELAHLAQGRIRREECLARYGGEEFAAVLPESGPEKARIFAERLVRQVCDHAFMFEGEKLPVTISAGLAHLAPAMTEPSQFIKAADAELYRAKREGRNRVCG
jgi:two-component system cell cycle response regulator